jgi:hypothetical protein
LTVDWFLGVLGVNTYAYMAFFSLIWSVRLGTLLPWCIVVAQMELKNIKIIQEKSNAAKYITFKV